MDQPELTDEVGVYLYAQNLALRHAVTILAGLFFADMQTRDAEYSLAIRKVFDAKLRSSLLTAFHSDKIIQGKLAEQAVDDLLKELGI